MRPSSGLSRPKAVRTVGAGATTVRQSLAHQRRPHWVDAVVTTEVGRESERSRVVASFPGRLSFLCSLTSRPYLPPVRLFQKCQFEQLFPQKGWAPARSFAPHLARRRTGTG